MTSDQFRNFHSNWRKEVEWHSCLREVPRKNFGIQHLAVGHEVGTVMAKIGETAFGQFRIWPNNQNLARTGCGQNWCSSFLTAFGQNLCFGEIWPNVFLHLLGVSLCLVVVVCKIFGHVLHVCVRSTFLGLFGIFGCVQDFLVVCARFWVCSTFFGEEPSAGPPTFRLFSLSHRQFCSFFSFWVSSRGIVTAIQGRGPPKVRVWAPCGHCVKLQRLAGRPGSHTMTPGIPNVHFGWTSACESRPHFHETTPREGKKERNWQRERENSAKSWPRHPSALSFFWVGSPNPPLQNGPIWPKHETTNSVQILI